MLLNHLSQLGELKKLIRLREPPLSMEVAREITAPYRLPEEYLELMCKVNNMELLGSEDFLLMYSLGDAALFTSDNFEGTDLGHLFLFGVDGGGRWYAMDVENAWGKGLHSIFFIPRGSMKKEYSTWLAGDLKELFDKLNQSISFSDLPWMDEE
jgi:hypothetical protein